jgi:hypothetical protein
MAPLKLLLSGYALAGLAAIGLAAQGAGALGPLLVFWFGGAVAVLTLGMTPGLRGAFRAEAAAIAAEDDIAAGLAQFERDRVEDAAAAATAATSATRRAAG